MSTEKLIYSLRQVLIAEQQEQDARECYDGDDWGYDGLQWADACHKASNDLITSLNKVIDDRVRAALADAESQSRNNGKS